MAAARTMHSDLWRVFLLTLTSLFLALQTEGRDFIQRIDARINAETQLTPAQKADEIAVYDTHKLSMACDAANLEDHGFQLTMRSS